MSKLYKIVDNIDKKGKLINDDKFLLLQKEYNDDMTEIEMENIVSIRFICDSIFDRNLDNVKWSSVLRIFDFGYYFNKSLDNVIFPDSLEELKLGGIFNCSLDNFKFPQRLKNLEMSSMFNQSLTNIKWSNDIESIKFGYGFKKPLDNLPNKLRILQLENVNYPIDISKYENIERLIIPIKYKYMSIDIRKSIKTKIEYYGYDFISENFGMYIKK